MHSSRMHTAHALTISGGGLVHPRRNFGEKKLKKKEKNLETPPKKWETPRKIVDTPRKIGDPPKNWRPPCEQNHTRL